MAIKSLSPFQCHVFVCSNDRQGKRKSCADGDSTNIRDRIKAQVEAHPWAPRVRVSHSGCFGLCAEGPNVMLYPQGTWFSQVKPYDVERIVDEIAAAIGENSSAAQSD